MSPCRKRILIHVQHLISGPFDVVLENPLVGGPAQALKSTPAGMTAKDGLSQRLRLTGGDSKGASALPISNNARTCADDLHPSKSGLGNNNSLRFIQR